MRYLLLFLTLCAGCSHTPTPVISAQHPVCITYDIRLDGKVNPIQDSNQNLFTIQGQDQGKMVNMTVCYKGVQ